MWTELGSRPHSSINIDLWPDGAWTFGELEDLVEIFETLGPTSGQISSEIRGVELQIGIAFATGAIASGFFGELGEDLYGSFKAKLKRYFLKGVPKARLKERIFQDRVSLSFRYPVTAISRFMMGKKRPELRVYYNCAYSREIQLDSFLSSLKALDNLIHKGHDLRLYPFDVGQAFDVSAMLEFKIKPTWNVRVLRYRKKTDFAIDGDYFYAKTSSKLDDLKWEQIHWLNHDEWVAGQVKMAKLHSKKRQSPGKSHNPQ